jgi:tRNA pseudouridine38-40 synthase
VVHFDTDAPQGQDLPRLLRALNALLPGDVAVHALALAPPDFHARYSASARRYCYRILNAPTPSPRYRRFAGHVRVALAVEPMRQAVQHLLGTHDFRAFGAQEGPGSTVRVVYGAAVTEWSAADSPWPPWAPWAAPAPIWHTQSRHRAGGPAAGAAQPTDPLAASGGSGTAVGLIEVRVEANAFLRHMMRRIAGMLIRVGAGRLAPEVVASAVATRDKALAGPAAPAAGLCLEWVRYPPGVSLDLWRAGVRATPTG